MTRPNISFEFFPPRDLAASFRLWEAVTTLQPLDPSFVSVTYGAGGSTRALTHEAVTAISTTTDLTVAAHLTCVQATRDETMAIAREYNAAGVNQIVALRGDPADGASGFAPHPDGFAGSTDLVKALADTGNFHIRVGAYPDGHPEAADIMADVRHLKAKFDAGADSAITQFFFDVDSFLRFRDACSAAGIDKPIIPGILPIENWAGVQRFAARCGAKLPDWLVDAFSKATRDGREDLLAIAVATEICADLMEEGVEDLHFYTLNKPHLTREVCKALGITPCLPLSQVA